MRSLTRCRSARFGKVAAGAAAAALSATAPAHAAPLPPQGVYEGCAPGTTSVQTQACVERLRTIRAGGFTIVLNYSAFYGSPAQVAAYAAAADRFGVRLIWPLHHPRLTRDADVSGTFAAMAAACGCTSPQELIPFMVGVVKDLPATYMYYVGDEPDPSVQAAVAANARLVRATDPAHPRFLVHYREFEQTIEPIIGDLDVVGADPYPVGLSTGLSEVGTETAELQRIADRHGVGTAVVLQAFSWGPSYYPDLAERFPTPAEYRAMRELAVENARPRFILWWSASSLWRTGDPQRWSDLVQGAFAPPEQAAQAPGPASATPEPAPSRRSPSVRLVTVRRHRCSVRVRFALTASAPTLVGVRSAGVGRVRGVQGDVAPRTVRLRLERCARRILVRLAPLGGVRLLVRVPTHGVITARRRAVPPRLRP